MPLSSFIICFYDALWADSVSYTLVMSRQQGSAERKAYLQEEERCRRAAVRRASGLPLDRCIGATSATYARTTLVVTDFYRQHETFLSRFSTPYRRFDISDIFARHLAYRCHHSIARPHHANDDFLSAAIGAWSPSRHRRCRSSAAIKAIAPISPHASGCRVKLCAIEV